MSKTTAWLFIHSHGEGGSEAISSNNLKPTALTLSMTLFLSVIVSISYALELSLNGNGSVMVVGGFHAWCFPKRCWAAQMIGRWRLTDAHCHVKELKFPLYYPAVLIYSSYTALQWLEQGSSQYLIFTLHAIAPWARFCHGDKVVIEDLLMLKMLLYWDATVKALFNCGPSWYDASLFFLLAVPHWWCWCDSVSL